MKKFLLTFFIVLTLFFSKTSVAWGQSSNAWNITPDSIVKAGDKPSLENLGKANILIGVSTAILGATGPGDNQNGGAAGIMSNMVIAMAQQPGGISTVEYLADMGHDLGIMPKEAYAQGSSFAGLSPVLRLWKTMRDLTYLIYVVVFMIVGFMILLRKKIDPRTIITIEMALPKLIISLILITFSYAIIALMVDGANLVSRVGASFFVGTGKDLLHSKTPGEAIAYLTTQNIFKLVRPIGDAHKIAIEVGEAFQGNNAFSGIAIIANITTWAIFSFAALFITFKIFFLFLDLMWELYYQLFLLPSKF